jgi:site-specific DNA recombinase
MNDLEKYNRFTKPRKKEKTLPSSREVWVYTRVSSRSQKDNYSLGYQKEEAQKFAAENGYKITEYFGNLNESASKDITRKEFQSLIHKVKKSRKKPFGILVYVISRFSRSGGSAVGIVDNLVEELRVHLIEVNSGLDTTSHVGKQAILRKLLDANDENYNRKQHTIPGMKKFVKSGQNFGIVPIGYDHYGPRVVDPQKRDVTQRIVINEDGIKLRKAWKWKLEGLSDVDIVKKLDALGIKISKQKISRMWRNAFYCGIQTNAFLDGKPIKGNWEPLISEKFFWAVQLILDGNNQGYTVEKDNGCRPLIGTLYCPNCGKKLTGYEVKKKGLHYYKCQKCNGVSINAESSTKMKTKGAHQMFIELLDSFRLDDQYIQPFILQLKKTFVSMKKEEFENRDMVAKKLKVLEADLDTLDERFAYGRFDDDALYHRLHVKKQGEIDHIKEQLKDSDFELSNLDLYIEKSIEISQNIHKYWQLGSLDEKRKIQKMVFPEGIVVDTVKRTYLTSKVNSLFLAKSQFKRTSGGTNKKLPIKSDEESSLVAGVGLEPTTFGL